MWRWRADSLTVRLTGTLVLVLTLLLIATAVVQVSLQRRSSEESARLHGLLLSETLFSALHGTMLANDRQGLNQAVKLITERSSDIRVRIFNKEGDIVFSSNRAEVGSRMDPQSEACTSCHRADRPIERLPPGDRTRLFTVDGVRAMGVIKPIENELVCSNAACHAHPRSRRLLGVLDVTQILGRAERMRRQTSLLMVAAFAGVLLVILTVVVVVVRRAVHRPMRQLTRTMDTLRGGDYSARFEVRSRGGEIAEFAHLGESVNRMAQELQRANAKLVNWAQTLERRVEEKTAELQHTQEQMLRVERMASLGKLAATVAHEINNPLASVVTYSRLLLRRIARQPQLAQQLGEQVEVLEAIAAESVRCGEIVSDLLLFARRSGTHMQSTDVNEVVNRSLFLLKHKLDQMDVVVERRLDPELPRLVCDAGQLEQALLALCINGAEAMPEGGTLTVATSARAGGIAIEVIDTGVGIPEEVLPHVFEPFFSTKGEGEAKGLGLGLAVVYGIVQRNNGAVEVQSTVGRGTTFSLTFAGGDDGNERSNTDR